MALLTTTTKAQFKDKVLHSDKVVLVDFWAAWCMPCRMMAPALESVGKSMDDKLDVVKVNIEQSQDNGLLAQKYGVRGIPNMQVFRDGKVIKEMVGMRPAAALEVELRALV